MSGHRVRRDPFYKSKPWRWGPAGWYCCGNRLMAAGTLTNGTPVQRCLHCGVVVAVAGGEIIEQERPVRQAGQGDAVEQMTFRL